MRLLPFSVVLGATFCVPQAVRADSDGYYCTGASYIAYQFGAASGMAHRLQIIRVSEAGGIAKPLTLPLPQFQVHGMVCGDGWVDMASFTDVYRVNFDSTGRPVAYAVRSLGGEPVPQAFISSQLQNLGELGGRRAYKKPPIRKTIGKAKSGNEFVLEVTATDSEPPKPCEIMVRSRIVELDSSGHEMSSRPVFQGRGGIECGE